MKRETKEWLRQVIRDDMDPGPHPARDALDSHAALRAELRRKDKALRLAQLAVGLEIVPEHDGYAGSPEEKLVKEAHAAIDAALKKPTRRKSR